MNVLRAFADLGRLAIPHQALVEVARIYAEGLDEIQRRVVEVFTFVDSHCWDDEHAQRFREMFSAEAERFARDVRVIADYTQQRNLQRAVLAEDRRARRDHRRQRRRLRLEHQVEQRVVHDDEDEARP